MNDVIKSKKDYSVLISRIKEESFNLFNSMDVHSESCINSIKEYYGCLDQLLDQELTSENLHVFFKKLKDVVESIDTNLDEYLMQYTLFLELNEEIKPKVYALLKILEAFNENATKMKMDTEQYSKMYREIDRRDSEIIKLYDNFRRFLDKKLLIKSYDYSMPILDLHCATSAFANKFLSRSEKYLNKEQIAKDVKDILKKFEDYSSRESKIEKDVNDILSRKRDKKELLIESLKKILLAIKYDQANDKENWFQRTFINKWKID